MPWKVSEGLQPMCKPQSKALHKSLGMVLFTFYVASFPGSHIPSFHHLQYKSGGELESGNETMNPLCFSTHTQLPVCFSPCVHVTLRCLSPMLPTTTSCRVLFALPLPHILRSPKMHSTSLLSPCQAVSIPSVHTVESLLKNTPEIKIPG